MHKVLIDFDFGNYQSSIVSGHLVGPAISGALATAGTYQSVIIAQSELQTCNVSDSLNFLNAATIENLVDGPNMQSASTLNQVNSAASGCVTLTPSSQHNLIEAQNSAIVPLIISGASVGHEVDLQQWGSANVAKVDSTSKIWGYGLDAGEQQITRVALTPTLSGHAISYNFQQVREEFTITTCNNYTDTEIGNLGDGVNLNMGRTSGTIAYGNHEMPILFDDFVHTFNAQSNWDATLAGTGNAYNQSNYSYGGVTITDPGDGYYRITNGANTASTDNVFVKPRDETSWGSIFSGRQRKHIWRASLNGSTNNMGSFGIMGGTIAASGVRPGPSYVFVFDSANTNIYFESDDNGGNITTTDTGVAMAADRFWNFEIHAVSGQVNAYIDGAEVATRTSNFPTGNDVLMYPFFWWEGNGTSWRGFLVDSYIYYGDRDRFQDGIFT